MALAENLVFGQFCEFYTVFSKRYLKERVGELENLRADI